MPYSVCLRQRNGNNDDTCPNRADPSHPAISQVSMSASKLRELLRQRHDHHVKEVGEAIAGA